MYQRKKNEKTTRHPKNSSTKYPGNQVSNKRVLITKIKKTRKEIA